VHPIRRRSRKHCSGARILPDEVRFEVGSRSTAPLANISYMPDITGILRFVIVNASKAIDSIIISQCSTKPSQGPEQLLAQAPRS
jgi:hypothetical protein